MTFFLISVFQIKAFLTPLEVGCFLIIVVNFVTNEHDNHFWAITKCFIVSCFCNIFLIGGLIALWSLGFTIFQSRIPKRLLLHFKLANTCEDEKRRQTVLVLK